MGDSTAMSVGTASDADGEPVDTRERLVRAAIEVFLEKGYGGTRVQDIARRAGFTSGALYVHFPSRTALLDEAIVREGDAILRSMVARLREVPRGEGRVAVLLGEFAGSAPTDPDRLLLEALALATRDPEARAHLDESLRAFTEAVVARVAVAVEGGAIDPGLSHEAVAWVLISWVFGAVLTNALGLVEVSADEIAAIEDRLLTSLRPA